MDPLCFYKSLMVGRVSVLAVKGLSGHRWLYHLLLGRMFSHSASCWEKLGSA